LLLKQEDPVFQRQFALFQATNQQIVGGRVLDQVYDNQIEVAMFHLQLVEQAADVADFLLVQRLVGHAEVS